MPKRLGLPDELLRALGGDGRATGSSEGDALAAAEEVSPVDSISHYLTVSVRLGSSPDE